MYDDERGDECSDAAVAAGGQGDSGKQSEEAVTEYGQRY